jgi:camphor 5-monooxygenase
MEFHPLGIPAHVPLDRVVDIDLYRLSFDGDVHGTWKSLQDSSSGGLYWTPRNEGHWIVTRGRDIARIYADHETFSSRITLVPRRYGEQFPLRPTTLDPPEHRPYRKRLGAALSVKRVRAAEPMIRGWVATALDSVRPRCRCEFMADFAANLPLQVFLHLAGLPPERPAMLPRYAEDPTEAGANATPVMDRYADYLRPLVAERQRAPGDDLLSELVAGSIDGRPVTEDEGVELATAVLTGGLDTVRSALGFAMAFLARSADHRQRLIGDPSRIGPAVQEMLRRFPLMTKARLLTRDHDIDGVTLKAGDMVVLPPLHGLDEREFADPLSVNFDRLPGPHSAFGNGVHRCPGALLTQLELEVTVGEWLRRIPQFAVDPLRPPRVRSGVLTAMLELHLQWTPS